MAYDSASRSDEAVLADFLADAGFNRDRYLSFNPDLAQFDDARLLEHMLEAGLSEHRRLPLSDPFGSARLLTRSPDCSSTRMLARAVASEIAVVQLARKGVGLAVHEIDAARGLRSFGVEPFLLVGDSHSEAYAQATIPRAGFLPLWHCCPGASMKGLANKTSSGNHGAAIRSLLSGFDDLRLVMMFGGADLEFCHPFRRLRAGEWAFSQASWSRDMESALSAYSLYLAELDRPVIIAGALPTAMDDANIRDAFAKAQVGFLSGYPGDLRADLDKLEFPPEVDRNNLHQAFNWDLVALGRPMLWPSEKLVGANGALRPDLRKGVDHHMCFETAWPQAQASVLAALN